MNTLEQNMPAAIAYADKTWPGWENRIDFNKVFMTDARKCFAGHLSGGVPKAWREASAAIGIDYPNELLWLNPFAATGAVSLWRAEQLRRLTAAQAVDEQILDSRYESLAPATEGPIIRTGHQQRLDDIASLLRASRLVTDKDVVDYCIATALEMAEGR